MTTPTPSRSPERTLADIIEVVQNSIDLPKTTRQNMASAVRTAARVLGRPPHLIPADPVLLGRQLEQISPIAIEMSSGRWANIRSFVRKAMSLTRQVMPGRYRSPLSPAWTTLFDQLSQSKGPRLSRLCHWLSASGIEPEQVTAAQIEAFGVELRTTSLSKDPEQTWRDAVWAWNNVRNTIDGWPDIELSVEVRRQTYTLPWDAFAPAFKEDVDRYLARIGGKINLRGGPVRPVRPTTLAKRAWELRAFASALTHQGVPITSLTGIAALFEGENFVLGLEFFLNRNDGASTPGLEDMSAALVHIARYHVGPGTLDIDAMKQTAKRLQVKTTGMTAKNSINLLPFNDPQNVGALVSLPERLKRDAERCPNRLKAARLLELAVAIEILLMTAMRAANLRMIEFGV